LCNKAAAGGTRAPISGQALIDRTFGGQLPNLATPAARGWPDRARSIGFGLMTGVAIGLEVVDKFDPIFGPLGPFGGSPAQ
jgi:hypothetical protein